VPPVEETLMGLEIYASRRAVVPYAKRKPGWLARFLRASHWDAVTSAMRRGLVAIVQLAQLWPVLLHLSPPAW
jgi:hypothetical protein